MTGKTALYIGLIILEITTCFIGCYEYKLRRDHVKFENYIYTLGMDKTYMEQIKYNYNIKF